MRSAWITLPALGLLANVPLAYADSVKAPTSQMSKEPAVEGRAASETGTAPASGAIDDTQHSIGGADPSRADFPPSRESKGP